MWKVWEEREAIQPMPSAILSFGLNTHLSRAPAIVVVHFFTGAGLDR
jgi:hypothetical protein